VPPGAVAVTVAAVFTQVLVPGAVGATGVGFTVIVYVFGVPTQPFTVAITVIVAVTGVEPVFTAVIDGILVFPLAARPIEGSELVQVNVPPAGVLVNVLAATVAPLQIELFAGTVVVGVGFTVTVATAVPEHPPFVPVTVYDVVAVGDTDKGTAVEPVFHE